MGKSSCMYWDGRLEEERQEEVRRGSAAPQGAAVVTLSAPLSETLSRNPAFLSLNKET